MTLKIIRNVLNYLMINLYHNRKSYSRTPESEIKAVMLELMKALKTFDPYDYDAMNIQNGKFKASVKNILKIYFCILSIL